MIYEDDKLCPKAFEKMAKEYALQTKKIKIIDAKNKENLQKITNEVLQFFDIISCITNNLKKFKLNVNYSKKLDKILKNINNLENYVVENNYTKKEKMPSSNYCALLVKMIITSTDARQKLDALDDCAQDYSILKNSLDEIIKISATMFGVCKYRKLED